MVAGTPPGLGGGSVAVPAVHSTLSASGGFGRRGVGCGRAAAGGALGGPLLAAQQRRMAAASMGGAGSGKGQNAGAAAGSRLQAGGRSPASGGVRHPSGWLGGE